VTYKLRPDGLGIGYGQVDISIPGGLDTRYPWKVSTSLIGPYTAFATTYPGSSITARAHFLDAQGNEIAVLNSYYSLFADTSSGINYNPPAPREAYSVWYELWDVNESGPTGNILDTYSSLFSFGIGVELQPARTEGSNPLVLYWNSDGRYLYLGEDKVDGRTRMLYVDDDSAPTYRFVNMDAAYYVDDYIDGDVDVTVKVFNANDDTPDFGIMLKASARVPDDGTNLPDKMLSIWVSISFMYCEAFRFRQGLPQNQAEVIIARDNNLASDGGPFSGIGPAFTWIHAMVVGNTLTFETFHEDPASGATPTAYIQHELTGQDAIDFGEGAGGWAGMGPLYPDVQAEVSGQSYYIDFVEVHDHPVTKTIDDYPLPVAGFTWAQEYRDGYDYFIMIRTTTSTGTGIKMHVDPGGGGAGSSGSPSTPYAFQEFRCRYTTTGTYTVTLTITDSFGRTDSISQVVVYTGAP